MSAKTDEEDTDLSLMPAKPFRKIQTAVFEAWGKRSSQKQSIGTQSVQGPGYTIPFLSLLSILASPNSSGPRELSDSECGVSVSLAEFLSVLQAANRCTF